MQIRFDGVAVRGVVHAPLALLVGDFVSLTRFDFHAGHT
jgi:hypothetical protein